MKIKIDTEKLKKLYLRNVNINQYLRKKTNLNEDQIIKLSYNIYIKK